MADQARPIDRAPSTARPVYVGRYRIRRRPAGGGTCDVVEADGLAQGRVVVVKVLRPDVGDSLATRERFRLEARAAATLQHDHIVTVLDFSADGPAPFLVLPLLAGESLRDRLKREPVLPVADVVRVGREAAYALAAAHAAGLLHGDFKPSNLWLETTPTGWRVRVLDFGLR